MPTPLHSYEMLLQHIQSRSARVGIIGLGYVGLPLATVKALIVDTRNVFSRLKISGDNIVKA
ncbi:hypothetical protein [Rhizobium sp. SL42]|uniref:hypothetical protein n=1 Tax=Rhizobium sp. SL42 TaxID=2806346 RepID=UPI001F2B5438|nr:hypothetical protein [Rhizobium sp. SL42]UJW76920.1 hypothetical protein IM739_00575 [Rhizobium sp. SL42]